MVKYKMITVIYNVLPCSMPAQLNAYNLQIEAAGSTEKVGITCQTTVILTETGV
jgi:hypothetical protein